MSGYATIGLITQVIFLGIGIYVYLFSRGLVKFGNESTRAKSEAFRKENATWMRLLGLALSA
ncbi:MAG: hypothetical protein AAFU67_12345, partial [Bacteroidota bacterium]